jgi:acetyl-CoA acetyltransferase
VLGALADAGIEPRDVDGFGVSSFSLLPDHAIDLAWRLGLRLRWLMEDSSGGASGLNMLQHAVRAIEAGDAETIVLCAGDRIDREGFRTLVEHYNRATRDYLRPLPFGGPNSTFAFLTERHARANALARGPGGIPAPCIARHSRSRSTSRRRCSRRHCAAMTACQSSPAPTPSC